MRFRPLFAVMIVVFSLLARSSQAETITLAADVWCPYNCAEGGYMIEIARDIFQKNNIDIEYLVMPWTEAVKKTRSGEIDAVIGATHEDTPDFIFPENLQGMSDMRFWVLEDSNWTYSGIDSLKSIRLGVVADYAYSKELNAYIKEHMGDTKHIVVAKGNNALDQNLIKLKAREIDAIAEDDNVISYHLTSHSAEFRIKSVGTPIMHEELSSNYLYIAFSPQNPNSKKYAAMLDAGMKELRETGQLKKILDIYQVNDWYGISKK